LEKKRENCEGDLKAIGNRVVLKFKLKLKFRGGVIKVSMRIVETLHKQPKNLLYFN